MATAPDFEKLMDIASASDREELELVSSCRTSAMAALKAHPGKDTKADYDASRDLLQETLERLHRTYFPEEAPTPEGERFKNRVQALNWLQAQGYKVSQGKFYGDCKAGFPVVQKDGGLSRYQVLQYAQQQDVERRNSPLDTSAEETELNLRKLRAETQKKERENEDSRRELDQKWLHMDAAWEALAALIGSLQAALDHQCHVGAPGLVHSCGGNPTRAEETTQAAKGLVSNAFTEILSAGSIEGIFSAAEEDWEPAT